MAKKRGFLAEINHQNKVQARDKEKNQRERVRVRAAAVRKHEQAQRAEQKAVAQVQRAAVAEQKRLEKVAKEAHLAAMAAEVEALNSGLAETVGDLESLLSSTLEVDDFVDLEAIRDELLSEIERQPMPPWVPPAEPQYLPPPAPTGLGSILGKKRHVEEVSRLEAAFAMAISEREIAIRNNAVEREESQRRRESAAEQHSQIDSLIANLGYGVGEAIEEYVSIVVSNSVYPEVFEVSHDFNFVAESAELVMHAIVPEPTSMPITKAYKYTKASDEITSTDLSQKAQKDLYTGAIHQVALRTLHEIFEADRRGLIRTIALQVGPEAPNPATGVMTFLPFIAVSAEREPFLEFDLSAVQPAATLDHLGASVSKNPFGLVAADTKGVRAL